MRRKNDVVQFQQCGLNLRFPFENVKSGSRNLSRLERARQRLFVHDRTTGVLTTMQLGFIEPNVLSFSRCVVSGSNGTWTEMKSDVESNVSRLDGFHSRSEPPGWYGLAVEILNLHVESHRAPGHGLTDAPESNDADGLSINVVSQQHLQPHAFHSPERAKLSPSTTRRAAAIKSVQAKSAVVSVSTPGVLVTRMPRRVAFSMSTLLNPTAMLQRIRTSGMDSRTSRSIDVGELRNGALLSLQPRDQLLAW